MLEWLLRKLGIIWALPNTLIGIVIGLLGLMTGGRVQSARDTTGRSAFEFYGGLVSWLLRNATPLPNGAAAMTIGHVILGVDTEQLELCRSHEFVHVRQYERWGPFFLFAYGGASVIAYFQGKHFYRDNYFECQARMESWEEFIDPGF